MAIKIALAGNPNCGKTTMFNALTGANQYVGNWPGVTVEKKEGKLKSKSQNSTVIMLRPSKVSVVGTQARQVSPSMITVQAPQAP